MSAIRVTGCGAVSPAGWTVPALRDAAAKGEPLEPCRIDRPGWPGIEVLKVPSPAQRLPFLSHARLRRSSPITQFTVASALEALGPDPGDTSAIGVVVSVFSGCVGYSRRFYGETLRDPGTASPLVFPETVFNAPASHLSAYLGSTAINYTLVGDTGTYLTALATAAQWLAEGRVDRCLVVGAEETDWLTADAVRLFDKRKLTSEGAGALLLERGPGPGVELAAITDEHLIGLQPRRDALRKLQQQLMPLDPDCVLLDSISGPDRISREESALWHDWPGPRLSIRSVLGEGLMAASAWQCVLAVDALRNHAAAQAAISISGFHQHAIGAAFRRAS